MKLGRKSWSALTLIGLITILSFALAVHYSLFFAPCRRHPVPNLGSKILHLIQNLSEPTASICARSGMHGLTLQLITTVHSSMTGPTRLSRTRLITELPTLWVWICSLLLMDGRDNIKDKLISSTLLSSWGSVARQKELENHGSPRVHSSLVQLSFSVTSVCKTRAVMKVKALRNCVPLVEKRSRSKEICSEISKYSKICTRVLKSGLRTFWISTVTLLLQERTL